MAVTSFQDLPVADRDREWDGAAAERRVRDWADALDEPNAKYRDAHMWYDADKKDNFTAYKTLIADVVDGKLVAVPRGVMPAANVIQGGRGGDYYGHERRYDDYDRRYHHDHGGIGPGKGALIGGAGGAALGALFSGSAKGALIGGAAGAGIGAIIGQHAQDERHERRY